MLPLEGKRILVVRSRQQASELARQLETLGATALTVPAIEIVPPASFEVLDHALEQLDTYDWLIFTSANAVEVFVRRRIHGLLPKSVAVIGPATAKAVEAAGLTVNLLPARYMAESLAEAITPHVAGRRVLLIRAEEARDVLPDALAQAGAEVTVAAAYRNQLPLESVSVIKEMFSSSETVPHAIMFTSASTVRNLLSLMEAAEVPLSPSIVFASIGPITSAALREQGLEPTFEASEATLPALVQAISDRLK
jgi:uroporphyrinogen-III synthase